MHHLVAAYLSYKPPTKASPVDGGVPDVGQLLGEIGNVPISKYTPIDSSEWDRMMADKKGSSEHG